MNQQLTDKLISLDAAGFLICPGESAEEFLQRVDDTYAVYAQFDERLASGETIKVFELFEVNSECRISPELSAEAADITNKLYGFSVNHVPGFYLTRQIGLLWGGCLIGDPEQNFAVFLLRNAFRRKRRFLNYRREELLAHELCHSVRHVLEEPVLEEYFAYQTSPSGLRRYMGNCFISDRDAWGFLLPVMLLPVAELIKALWLHQFPAWIFWILALVYPVFLLVRNHRSRKLASCAGKNISQAGASNPHAVLFRCTLAEIREFAACQGDAGEIIRKKCENELRWKIIRERFFPEEEKITADKEAAENED